MAVPEPVMSDLAERRGLLTGHPNPGKALDYVVRLEARIGEPGPLPATVTLCYVPDRLILDPAAFGTYTARLARGGWSSPEELAVIVLEDLCDALVPRWARVVVAAQAPAAAGIAAHVAALEERQPDWDNDALLARLADLM